jgi:hypothetical protein
MAVEIQTYHDGDQLVFVEGGRHFLRTALQLLVHDDAMSRLADLDKESAQKFYYV